MVCGRYDIMWRVDGPLQVECVDSLLSWYCTTAGTWHLALGTKSDGNIESMHLATCSARS